QTGLMGATVVEVLVAEDAAPVAFANALEGRHTVSVKTPFEEGGRGEREVINQRMLTHLQTLALSRNQTVFDQGTVSGRATFFDQAIVSGRATFLGQGNSGQSV